jgi:hypothetical protein
MVKQTGGTMKRKERRIDFDLKSRDDLERTRRLVKRIKEESDFDLNKSMVLRHIFIQGVNAIESGKEVKKP